MFKQPERRRTLRIKRSGLHNQDLLDLDRPAVKFAETREELEKAFSLVYQIYLQKKFITEPKPHQMLYSIYSLLPDTVHIIAKSYLSVISNLTQIFDTPEFGLPMDVIYRPELDELRNQGRKIVELSALATPREHRWKNIFHYLVQVMYWYSIYKGVDDVCIAVNPRHVRYYKNLFPFKELGPVRHYPRVDAPAVALRAKVAESKDVMIKICQDLEFDTPLYSYFHDVARQSPGEKVARVLPNDFCSSKTKNGLDSNTVAYFLSKDSSLLENVTEAMKEALNSWYPGLESE
ncbi:N-acyl amino acid synthase FeeM domain-containing protein [Desulfonatronovibrio hydrogenovorans]|uniref:N-acyl amino acid synthase FeeM domain-containing protein n=1 Tax=Desulfonatronovibrio hydrogenovorans TaxID=53245 RepID=UPI0012372362|nr:hypothetical protein [Desulfonatronovibrio hydrogenovorans]